MDDPICKNCKIFTGGPVRDLLESIFNRDKNSILSSLFNSKIRRRWSIRNWSRISLIALLVTNFDHCGGSCWYTVSEFHTVLKNIICWNSYRVPYFLRIKKYLPIFTMQKIFINQDFAWEEILESRSFDKALEKKLLEILSQINFQSKIFEKVFQRPWSSDFESFCHYFYLYFFSLFKFIYLFKDLVSNADAKDRYFGGRNVHKLAAFGQLWSTKTFTQKHCVKSVSFCIRTEYGEIRSISPYSVTMLENADQNNSKYGHFLRKVLYFALIYEN